MNGLLLVNTGTPDAPEPRAVRAYLREFLGDPRVLDMNAVGRWLLLNLVILRVRPARSAALYRRIWTDRGSPLLVHGRDLAAAVGAALGGRWRVELGMRYGRPTIAGALARLDEAGVDRLVVLPLFPQYASATVGTVLEAVYRQAGAGPRVPALAVVPPFHEHPAFLDAFAHRARPVLDELRPDHVVMSFHGLPERQVRRADPTGHTCLATTACCDALGPSNRACYRAQCFATARALTRALSLDPARTTVTFQSRLGRVPWIRPYTDEVLLDLARQGARRVAVLCPAFVADCLETLEEIGLRAREAFCAAGGEDLRLVPSLNAEPAWVEAVAALARETPSWALSDPGAGGPSTGAA